MRAIDAPIDSVHFRRVLGQFATGVVVVTGMHDDRPVGLSIGSFGSVSLQPPLVGFFPSRSSSSWPKIREAGAFAVNILSAHQEDVCRVFASTREEKFRSIGWRPGRSGSPILDGVIGWIDCRIADVVEAGDHYFVSGRVLDLGAAEESGPLVFFRGGYTRSGLS